MMFKCKECGATDFHLMVRPEFDGQVELWTNEHEEVVVKVAGRGEFIADLMFMNDFAVCKGCGGIKQWEYFFPRSLREMCAN